jgi:hypothetical protein
MSERVRTPTNTKSGPPTICQSEQQAHYSPRPKKIDSANHRQSVPIAANHRKRKRANAISNLKPLNLEPNPPNEYERPRSPRDGCGRVRSVTDAYRRLSKRIFATHHPKSAFQAPKSAIEKSNFAPKNPTQSNPVQGSPTCIFHSGSRRAVRSRSAVDFEHRLH